MSPAARRDDHARTGRTSLNALNAAMLDEMRAALGLAGRLRRPLPAADRRGPRLFERRRPRRRRRPSRRCRRGAGSAFQSADRGVFALPMPVVAAVRGPCAGAGCSLALAADIVIAGRSAYFLQAFINIGLIPDAGATWLLPRLAGRARAMEMMMLGERIPAEQAADWGMISRVVEDEDLATEAMALAARLAQGPTAPTACCASSPAMPSRRRWPTRSPPSASPSATPAAPRISNRGSWPSSRSGSRPSKASEASARRAAERHLGLDRRRTARPRPSPDRSNQRASRLSSARIACARASV